MFWSWKLVAEWLRLRKNFSDIEIGHFQSDVDHFCDLYHKLTGRPGETNYVHILKSGHDKWHLLKHRSFYKLFTTSEKLFCSIDVFDGIDYYLQNIFLSIFCQYQIGLGRFK